MTNLCTWSTYLIVMYICTTSANLFWLIGHLLHLKKCYLGCSSPYLYVQKRFKDLDWSGDCSSSCNAPSTCWWLILLDGVFYSDCVSFSKCFIKFIMRKHNSLKHSLRRSYSVTLEVIGWRCNWMMVWNPYEKRDVKASISNILRCLLAYSREINYVACFNTATTLIRDLCCTFMNTYLVMYINMWLIEESDV